MPLKQEIERYRGYTIDGNSEHGYRYADNQTNQYVGVREATMEKAKKAIDAIMDADVLAQIKARHDRPIRELVAEARASMSGHGNLACARKVYDLCDAVDRLLRRIDGGE